MVLVRERGQAMAEAAAATADRDDRGPRRRPRRRPGQARRARPHRRQRQRRRPDRRRRHAGAARRARRRPARGRAAAPARRSPARSTPSTWRPRWDAARARPAVSTHDPRTRLLSNRDGAVVHDGARRARAASSTRSRSPVRWDLCMRDDGRPRRDRRSSSCRRPAPSPAWPSARSPASRPSRSRRPTTSRRRATSSPARQRQPGQPTPRPGACSWPRPRARSARSRRRRDQLEPGQAVGIGRHPARPAARSSRRTAARSSSGWSRTATRSPPVSRSYVCTPRRSRHEPPDASALRPPRPAATHSRILGVGGYRPARVVTNAEIVENIDSTDEWIRERSGIVEPGTRPRPTRPSSTWPPPLPRRRSPTPASPPTQHRPASSSPPSPTCWQTPSAAAVAGLPPRRDQGGRVRHLRRMRRLLPRAGAGRRHGRAPAPPSTSSSSASRSSPTWSTRTTAAPRSSSATVRAPPSSAGRARPGIGPVVWGADGSQADGHHADRVLADPPATTPGHKFPTLAMNGQQVFRWAVFQMAPVCAAGARGGRGHGRRPGRVHPAPGEPAHHRRDGEEARAARAASPSPGTSSTPATPRRPRSRWRWSACWTAARPRTAAWRCSSASVPAWPSPRRSWCCRDPAYRAPRTAGIGPGAVPR